MENGFSHFAPCFNYFSWVNLAVLFSHILCKTYRLTANCLSARPLQTRGGKSAMAIGGHGVDNDKYIFIFSMFLLTCLRVSHQCCFTVNGHQAGTYLVKNGKKGKKCLGVIPLMELRRPCLASNLIAKACCYQQAPRKLKIKLSSFQLNKLTKVNGIIYFSWLHSKLDMII